MIDLKDKETKIAVGAKIRTLRLESGMTLKDFGRLFDTSGSIVWRWENGTSLPNPKRLLAIADFAKMSVENLLEVSSAENIQLVQYIQDITSPEDLEIKFSIQEYQQVTGSDNVDELVHELEQLLDYRAKVIIPTLDIRMHGINMISEIMVTEDDVVVRFSKSTLFFRNNPNWLRDSKRNVVVQ